MNTVIKKTTEDTENTEISENRKLSDLCALCGKFYSKAGFGQSRSEVRIINHYNVERQMKVLQLTHCVIASISEAISNFIGDFSFYSQKIKKGLKVHFAFRILLL
jgi:ribosomal protein S13